MKKRDISFAQLKASADRCNGCKAFGNDVVCKAAKAQGACPKLNGGPFPPTWGQMPKSTPALDALMGVFKAMRIPVVDVTPKLDRADAEFLSRVAERGESTRPACLTFIVEGVPIGKGRPRFTRTGHCYTPDRTRKYENLVKLAYGASFIAAPGKVGRIPPPMTGPVLLTIRAYFPIPKSWPKAKREAARLETVQYIGKPDSSNVAKSVEDALNGLAYKDDSQCDLGGVTRRYSPRPRVEVQIEGAAE